MSWRVAASLIAMRDQLNRQFPQRNKSSDGTIGDAAHQSTTSDHNPWVKDAGVGVVTAYDFTHDPGNGVDSWSIAEYLRTQKDPRVKYVISNKRIFSSVSSPWTWRNYTGSNPHSSHCHVSVHSGKGHYDDSKVWKLVPPDWRPTLRQGDRGVFVSAMQGHLGIAADGVFGASTTSRVRQFQTTHGLSIDGVCGPLTWKALELEPEKPPITPPPEVIEPEPEPENPDLPNKRPVLRKGSKGAEVMIVQGLLMLNRSGNFDDVTDAAVRGFQRARAITVDGIVGVETWEELDTLEQIEVEKKWFTNIVTTVFGGASDPNKSAYAPYSTINDSEISCSLPARFHGDRPMIEIINLANGKHCVAELRDVGPWNTKDPYWETGKRPQAESGVDMSGRKTNLAGLDITPGAARALGLSGKGKCNWAFVTTKDEGA